MPRNYNAASVCIRDASVLANACLDINTHAYFIRSQDMFLVTGMTN